MSGEFQPEGRPSELEYADQLIISDQLHDLNTTLTDYVLCLRNNPDTELELLSSRSSKISSSLMDYVNDQPEPDDKYKCDAIKRTYGDGNGYQLEIDISENGQNKLPLAKLSCFYTDGGALREFYEWRSDKDEATYLVSVLPDWSTILMATNDYYSNELKKRQQT